MKNVALRMKVLNSQEYTIAIQMILLSSSLFPLLGKGYSTYYSIHFLLTNECYNQNNKKVGELSMTNLELRELMMTHYHQNSSLWWFRGNSEEIQKASDYLRHPDRANSQIDLAIFPELFRIFSSTLNSWDTVSQPIARLNTFVYVIDTARQEIVVDYEFVDISEIPENKKENAVKGKIYLRHDGKYIVRDPEGTVKKGVFNTIDSTPSTRSELEAHILKWVRFF